MIKFGLYKNMSLKLLIFGMLLIASSTATIAQAKDVPNIPNLPKIKDAQSMSVDEMLNILNEDRIDEPRFTPNGYVPPVKKSGTKVTSIPVKNKAQVKHPVAFQETAQPDNAPPPDTYDPDAPVDNPPAGMSDQPPPGDDKLKIDSSTPPFPTDNSASNQPQTPPQDNSTTSPSDQTGTGDETASDDQSNPDSDEPTFQQVKGGITEIRATVGKSQIIQFAQPITRLSVTDPSLADMILLSPTQMILNGKAGGVTSMIIWDETGQPAFFELYVQNDTSNLMDALKLVAPDEPLSIKLTDDGNVILSGTVSSRIVRDQIQKICEAFGYKLVDVSESPMPQVVLELKIAEIARSITKNFNTRTKGGGDTAPILQGNGWPNQLMNISHYPLISQTGTKLAGAEWNGNSAGGFQFALFRQQSRFSWFMQAAESRGLLNILAEPKLVATHGTEASFNAGNQVPVPTGVDQNGNLAYEYKDVGVKIAFKPTISEKSQRIELTVKPSVNEIDPSVNVTQPNGSVIYGFRTRDANTTVELENGETLMIAGLIRRNDNNTIATPPFLSTIPILGQLMMTSSFQRGESELIIMITPKIVKPGVYGDIVGTSE